MPELPRLELPAPWGAGVVLGLVRLLRRAEATDYRGALRVVQVDSRSSLDFVAGLRVLAAKARAKGQGFWEQVPMLLLCDRAPLGWVDLVACRPLPDGQGWAWRLVNPQRGGDLPPGLGHLAQPPLFGRA